MVDRGHDQQEAENEENNHIHSGPRTDVGISLVTPTPHVESFFPYSGGAGTGALTTSCIKVAKPIFNFFIMFVYIGTTYGWTH